MLPLVATIVIAFRVRIITVRVLVRESIVLFPDKLHSNSYAVVRVDAYSSSNGTLICPKISRLCHACSGRYRSILCACPLSCIHDPVSRFCARIIVIVEGLMSALPKGLIQSDSLVISSCSPSLKYSFLSGFSPPPSRPSVHHERSAPGPAFTQLGSETGFYPSSHSTRSWRHLPTCGQ